MLNISVIAYDKKKNKTILLCLCVQVTDMQQQKYPPHFISKMLTYVAHRKADTKYLSVGKLNIFEQLGTKFYLYRIV